jgi:hypothetical protein
MQVFVVLAEFTVGGRDKFSKEPQVFSNNELAIAYIEKEIGKVSDPWFKVFDGPLCSVWQCPKQYLQYEVHSVTVR